MLAIAQSEDIDVKPHPCKLGLQAVECDEHYTNETIGVMNADEQLIVDLAVPTMKKRTSSVLRR